jgi:K+-sensing histidine kinase KdpD
MERKNRGLSILPRAVHACKGMIEAGIRSGGGSRFRLRLLASDNESDDVQHS